MRVPTSYPRDLSFFRVERAFASFFLIVLFLFRVIFITSSAVQRSRVLSDTLILPSAAERDVSVDKAVMETGLPPIRGNGAMAEVMCVCIDVQGGKLSKRDNGRR